MANHRVIWGTCWVRRQVPSGELRWFKLPGQVEVATLYDEQADWAEHLMQQMVALAREELAQQPENVREYRVRVVMYAQDQYGAQQLHWVRTQLRQSLPEEVLHDRSPNQSG